MTFFTLQFSVKIFQSNQLWTYTNLVKINPTLKTDEMNRSQFDVNFT
jgi:hypothetical protein